MKKTWIGLLDCNNFFVSCERLFRPDLLNKPVIVLSSNDGCVVARSQEVKDIGVPMGVPYFQIKDILKKACVTTFSSNFSLYRDISKRVFSTLRPELNLMEQYSVDEAFFEIEAVSKNDLIKKSEQLRDLVQRQVGIPVSIGIAGTKTQAKYASHLAKNAGGICVLDDSNWSDLATSIPLEKIWGVGGKTELKLKKHGLRTVDELIKIDPAIVANLFGVIGVRLQQELLGNSVFKVVKIHDPAQSITSSRSFAKATFDKAVLLDATAHHVRHAATDLRKQGLEARIIRVFLKTSRHGDYVLRGGVREFVLEATADTFLLLKRASELMESLYESDVPFSKVGVILANLTPVNYQKQECLFETEAGADNELLMSIVDGLNKKTGKEIVMIGSRLRADDWRSRTKTQSPAYTTSWSNLASVSAR